MHFPDFSAPARRGWLLLLLFLLVYSLDLALPRDFWIQDEARYGEVVREMVVEGHWLIPHLGGSPYPDKPAPYFWLVAGVGTVVGQGEFSFRLVTLASTVAAASGVYLVALRLLGASVAFFASVVFLTSVLTLIVGHIMRMDMLLTAVTVHAWHSLVRWRSLASAPSTANVRWLIAFWALTALGLMVKGPISFLFTLLPAMLWLACEEDGRGVRGLRLGRGLGVLLLLVVCWAAAVYAQHESGYIYKIWHDQLIGRAVNAWSHREPMWFYLVLLPLLCMPWTALLPTGMRYLSQEHPLAFRSIVGFTLFPLVGLSLVSGKLFLYLEPIYPGLSIVAGSVAALRFTSTERVTRAVGWSSVLFFGFLAVGVGYGAHHSLAGGESAGLALAALLLLFTGVAVFRLRAPWHDWIRTHIFLMVGCAWLFFGPLFTLMNPMFSGRALGEYVAAVTPATMPVGVSGITRGILDYYTRRTLTELPLGDVSAWRTKNPGALVIVPTGALPTIFGAANVLESCRVRRAFTVETKEYYVVGDC